MDKLSLKALREKYEESLQAPPLGDYNALLGALPALLAIAEAARTARAYIYCSSLCEKSLTGDVCSCGAETIGTILDAALALVEE